MQRELTQLLIDSIRVAAEVANAAQQEYKLAVWSLIISTITAFGVVLLTWFLRVQHKQFNSRMDELKEVWKDQAFEKGKKEQREADISS